MVHSKLFDLDLFAINHDLYGPFLVLVSQFNAENEVQSEPNLFVPFHVTRIKSVIQQHCNDPDNNVLSENLDALLQSMYYLIPKHQPTSIQPYTLKHINDNDEALHSLLNTSYSSIFYRLHQEMKIQAIITCNKSYDIKERLLVANIKINQDLQQFDFRHMDISQDLDTNKEEVSFDLISLIQTLTQINKQKDSNEIDEFLQTHSFEIFKSDLYEYLTRIQSVFCQLATIDLILNASHHLSRNSKETQRNHQQQSKLQYLSKMSFDSQPHKLPPIQMYESNNHNHNRSRNTEQFEQKGRDERGSNAAVYHKGQRVQVRQKNKNAQSTESPDAFFWRVGKIIHLSDYRITVELQDENAHKTHMKIFDFTKIKPLDADDDDVIMLERNLKNNGISNGSVAGQNGKEQTQNNTAKNKKTGKKKRNATVQSADYARGRRFWEEPEKEALRAGLVKYKHLLTNAKKGVRGIWYHIKHDDEFEERLKHRTTQMLYDRYRWLKKCNKAPA